MPRLRFPIASPDGYQAMIALQKVVQGSGLEHPLLELVKVRASQINRCAFCLDMHWKDARAAGETEERLYMLSAWRESKLFNERERAALELTEAVTRIADEGVPDAVYEEVRRHFSEAELAHLTLSIALINSWNRLMITFGAEPGRYKPQGSKA